MKSMSKTLGFAVLCASLFLSFRQNLARDKDIVRVDTFDYV